MTYKFITLLCDSITHSWCMNACLNLLLFAETKKTGCSSNKWRIYTVQWLGGRRWPSKNRRKISLFKIKAGQNRGLIGRCVFCLLRSAGASAGLYLHNILLLTHGITACSFERADHYKSIQTNHFGPRKRSYRAACAIMKRIQTFGKFVDQT